MLGTAPATLTASTEAANMRKLLLSFQAIAPKNWGGCSESNFGGNKAEIKPCSDISYCSRYRKMEPWRGVSDILESLVCSSPWIRRCVGSVLSWVPVNCPFLVYFTCCTGVVYMQFLWCKTQRSGNFGFVRGFYFWN